MSDFPDVERTHRDGVIDSLVEEVNELKGKLARAEAYAEKAKEENKRLAETVALWDPLVKAAIENYDAEMGPEENHLPGDIERTWNELGEAIRRVREAEEKETSQ